MDRTPRAGLLRRVRVLTDNRRWLDLLVLLRRLPYEEFREAALLLSVAKCIPPRPNRSKDSRGPTERSFRRMPVWARKIPPIVHACILHRIWPGVFQEPGRLPEPEFFVTVRQAVRIMSEREEKKRRLRHPNDKHLRPDALAKQPGHYGPSHEPEIKDRRSKRERMGPMESRSLTQRESTDRELVHDFLHNSYVEQWQHLITSAAERKAAPEEIDDSAGTQEPPVSASSAPRRSRKGSARSKAATRPRGRRTQPKKGPSRPT